MSDVTDEAPAQPDTPTPETPVADTPQPEIDYAKRYHDLQPEYTRATQTLSDEEKLLEHIQAKFPHLIADDIENDLGLDPEPEAPAGEPQVMQDPRVDWLAAREAERQFTADLKDEAGDRDVSDFARERIYERTLALGGDREALKKATTEWFDYEDSLKPKPRPQAPHVPANGDTPSGEPEGPLTHQDRVKRAMARIQAEQA